MTRAKPCVLFKPVHVTYRLYPQKIKAALSQARRSQADLARACNFHRSRIHQLMGGRDKQVGETTVHTLVSGLTKLGIDCAGLLDIGKFAKAVEDGHIGPGKVTVEAPNLPPQDVPGQVVMFEGAPAR